MGTDLRRFGAYAPILGLAPEGPGPVTHRALDPLDLRRRRLIVIYSRADGTKSTSPSSTESPDAELFVTVVGLACWQSV
ncbi:MAG: hypothetical protein HQ453_13690 [Actinobacteria bacterium]|nr:hypothetical protein [Actinomycetota bacterium]